MNTLVRRLLGFSGFTRATVCLALLFGLALASPALARMDSASSIEAYALNLEDRPVTDAPATVAIPLPMSIGIAGMIQKREISFEGYATSEVEMRHLNGYLGLDLTPWFTVRALAGTSDFKPDTENSDRLSADLEWGLGAEARLLNWRVDPSLCNIAWIRFVASAQYLDAGADDHGDKVDWQECYGDLTVNLITTPPESDTLRNVCIFAGPAFSWIKGEVKTAEGAQSDFDEDERLGITTGLSLIPHDNISIKLELQIFSDISYGAALGFHF